MRIPAVGSVSSSQALKPRLGANKEVRKHEFMDLCEGGK